MANQKILTVDGKTYVFQFVDEIKPEYKDGKFIVYTPQEQYYKNRKNCPLNKHGKGPFCEFSLQNTTEESGVYLWVMPVENNQENIIYIGETQNFKQRFSATNYGHISPRNCYKGGQSTNCKMNHIVWDECIHNRNRIFIYFYATKEYKDLETKLIEKYKPEYNDKNNKQKHKG